MQQNEENFSWIFDDEWSRNCLLVSEISSAQFMVHLQTDWSGAFVLKLICILEL